MDQIEEIKMKTDMVALVSEYVKLTKAGKNYKGLCPFHGEKSPSFNVNSELSIFKCFGCGEGGDALTFLQKIEGMTFHEALQNLAKRCGVTLELFKKTDADNTREKLIEINTLAAQAYTWVLNKHKDGEMALGYLINRGIKLETIGHFGLGFAPDSWRFGQDFLEKKKGYKTSDLVSAGLLVEGKGYDRFRNRIMFPLVNHKGQSVGFAGRILPDEDLKSKIENLNNNQILNSNKIQNAKYINTPETEIFKKGEFLYGLGVNRSEIKKSGSVVMVEGPVDAIASWQAGVKNVVAVQGTALTEMQI